MLLHFLALVSSLTPQGAQPTLGNLAATPTDGACSLVAGPGGGAPGREDALTVATPATVTFNWTVLSPNDADYVIHVSLNGGAISEQSTSLTSWAVTLTGLVRNNDVNPTLIGTAIEVRVVRRSDGVTVQSLTNTYTATYGTCG